MFNGVKKKKSSVKIEGYDDLHVNIVTMDKKELVNNDACTVLNVMLNTDGDITTSFYGSYNKEILDYLIKINNKHLKVLRKKLLKNPDIDVEEKLNNVKNKIEKSKKASTVDVNKNNKPESNKKDNKSENNNPSNIAKYEINKFLNKKKKESENKKD